MTRDYGIDCIDLRVITVSMTSEQRLLHGCTVYCCVDWYCKVAL